jgi:hypothetical protein
MNDDSHHTRSGGCNNIDGQITSSENFGSEEERQFPSGIFT